MEDSSWYNWYLYAHRERYFLSLVHLFCSCCWKKTNNNDNSKLRRYARYYKRVIHKRRHHWLFIWLHKKVFQWLLESIEFPYFSVMASIFIPFSTRQWYLQNHLTALKYSDILFVISFGSYLKAVYPGNNTSAKGIHVTSLFLRLEQKNKKA